MLNELGRFIVVTLEVGAFVVGGTFCLLAGIGIIRMPDVYTRMQASTKAGTLGIACIIIGVAIHFGEALTGLEAALVIAFLFLTAPIASHLIARAAYILGVSPWDRNVVDDMAACYDPTLKELRNPDDLVTPPNTPPQDESFREHH
jgi:multicomponent Na+:H+ antiporter subunit G